MWTALGAWFGAGTTVLRIFGVLSGFTVLALAVFGPTWHELTRTVPLMAGSTADALLLAWAIGHVSRALFTDPLHLFDAGIYFPARGTLAVVDHNIGQALLGLPVWLASGNPLLEYNLLVLASYVLGASAMCGYAYARTHSIVAGLGAGVVFAFTPLRFNAPFWIQVLCTFCVPLALYFWLRFVRSLAWRDWAWWVAFWSLHSLMGMYLTLYFGVTMGLLALFALVAAPTRRARALWIGTLVGPLVTLALLGPTLWPYLAGRASQGNVRTWGLDTWALSLLPGPGTFTGRLAGVDGGPLQFGPGFVVYGLALLGVVIALRRWRDPWARFAYFVHWLGLAVTLALVFSPIHLQRALPGFDMIRCTNRAFYLSLFFLAAFVAEAIAWLGTRFASARMRLVVGSSLVVLLVLDMGTPLRKRIELPGGGAVPPVYTWLATRPEIGPIYEHVKLGDPSALAIYYALFHGKPIVNGFSGYPPPGSGYLVNRIGTSFPKPESLRLLDQIGVHHVVSHFKSPAAMHDFIRRLSGPELQVVARFDTDVVMRVGKIAPPLLPAAAGPLDPRGWTLTAHNNADALPALVDQDATTSWEVTVAMGAGVPWVVIDLGGARGVTGVRTRPASRDASHLTTRQVIMGLGATDLELSMDGTHWEGAPALFLPDSLDTLLRDPLAVGYYEARFPARAARYIRLKNPTVGFWGGPWQIAELDVLVDCTAAPDACGQAAPRGHI
jgi:hypothetical protein